MEIIQNQGKRELLSTLNWRQRHSHLTAVFKPRHFTTLCHWLANSCHFSASERQNPNSRLTRTCFPAGYSHHQRINSDWFVTLFVLIIISRNYCFGRALSWLRKLIRPWNWAGEAMLGKSFHVIFCLILEQEASARCASRHRRSQWWRRGTRRSSWNERWLQIWKAEQQTRQSQKANSQGEFIILVVRRCQRLWRSNLYMTHTRVLAQRDSTFGSFDTAFSSSIRVWFFLDTDNCSS